MKKKLFIALFAIIATVGNVFSQSMIISGGNDHGVALCSKGQVYAWGYNKGNRLCLKDPGDAAKEIVPSPSLVNTGNLTFSQLSGGSGGHSVALSCKKVVYCWGGNGEMQCGRPKSDYIEGGEPVPVYCGVADGYNLDGTPGGPYLGNVKYISATSAASMAILDDGTGRVVIWGGNTEGAGGVIETPTDTPVWITDKNGDPIKNVIHITGGDNNIMLIVGDSPDAKVGTVYSIGNWNGRGGDGDAKSFIAAPVEIGNGTGAKTSGKYLTNVRTSGLSDSGGFAVDGETGYVYGWGNGGWWGSCGKRNAYSSNIVYAEKVTSGEYETISGEAYLTDAIQVIGGNGNGTVVTQEGYVLYWGHNGASSATVTSGGVIPNSQYQDIESTADIGPVFANYCAGEHGKATEHRVEDAVAIARGDLYGFMVNSDGDFYVWGSTARPTKEEPKHVGALGTGNVKEISTCFKKIEISCTPQDLCPEAFMLPEKYKCPGVAEALYSGFTPLKGSENNYYYKWSKDGEVLNTSLSTDDIAKRKADIYNRDSIEVLDPGLYRVDIYYVGLNVPCDNCPDTYAECLLKDMEMPIDTILTQSCVRDTFAPDATDDVCFEFQVNNKFYKAGEKTTWKVFETETSKTALDTLDVKVGNKGEFCVTGDKVSVNKKDTTYSIFVEDYTKMQGTFFEKGSSTGKSGQLSGTQPFYLYVTIYSDVMLESGKISVAIGWDGGDYTLTPSIYKAGTDTNGKPIAGTKIKDGKPIKFSIPDCKEDATLNGVVKEIDLDFGELRLEGNPTRGASYFIFFNASNSINSTDIFTDLGPFADEFGGTSLIVHEVGQANSLTNFSANGSHAIYDLVYSKMTSYTCGRIELQSKFWCPPCNQPKELEITADKTISSDTKYKKIVELCKGEDVTLDIKPLVGKTDANAKFDILWFDKYSNKEADALLKDITGTATTLEFKTDWATVAAEDTMKVYYVYVHDHEKPGCENYDSIKVIAHPAPTDTLAWDTFCLTTPPTTEPALTITGKTITWTGVDPTGNIAALTATTSFDYTVTDDKTGCVSEPHTYTVTVNKTEVPDVDPTPSTTVDATLFYPLSSAVITPAAVGFEIRWYDENKQQLSSKDISRTTAGEYTFFAEMYNEETDCASEMVKVVLTINDAMPPKTTNESLCIGDNIPSLTEYVTKTLKVGETDADYELRWYSSVDATTPETSFNETFSATTEGVYTFYVSQYNVTTQAESGKTALTITVHNVATLDLSANRTSYCVTDAAEPLTFTANTDGDFTTAMWGTSTKSTTELTDPSANLSPEIVKGTATYYILPEYKNVDKVKSYASAVCYGAIQDIDVTVNFTDIPNPEKPTVSVQYLKAQGDEAGHYETILTQDPTAVTPDAGCTLTWYDENDNIISEPAPNYIAGETGERKVKYYVSQTNTTTGCESKKKEVIAVISSIPQPTTKAIVLCEGSDRLNSPLVLTAQKITVGGTYNENDLELVWYKEDPDTNPSATSYTSIDLSQENLNCDSGLEKDYTYYVRQIHHVSGGNDEVSPTAKLSVTIYANPILTATNPDPICKGESVDIKKLYKISNEIDNKVYENEYLSASGNDPIDGIAKEHGNYKSRAYFTLVTEAGTEFCRSEYAIITVTVNELSAEIVGDELTCPNIGKDMEAVLTTNNMLPTDVPSYSWNVSPTGKQGNTQVFNTTNNGLANKGDKLTIDLTVEMGACKATASHTLLVQNPGVNGTISFDEEDNTNSQNGKYTLTSTGIEFDGCNKKVDVVFEVDQTETEFTYENLETGTIKHGSFVNGKGEIDVRAGIYEVSYTNTCQTSFQFEVKDKSLDIMALWSNIVVCEGEPWNIEIKNSDLTDFVFDSRKYKKIEWRKDDVPLTEFNNKEVLNIPSTTPANNGVYSCIVQSSGCTSTIVIGMGGRFTSKPKVKVNEALLENGGVYEVVRTKDKSITIPFLNPTSAADLALLENNDVDGIIWKENGTKVNSGATYNLTNVTEDHDYHVIIARGNGGSNDNFCGTSVKVSLKVDALLAIKTTMVDETGKKTEDMCINETGTGILIDTTGTGKILHTDKLTLKVVESIDGNTKDVPIKANGDKLFAEISPSKSATYDIIYKYTVGNQDSSKTSKITVHPAFNVTWDETVRLCDEESGYIAITKKSPEDVILTWGSDPCIKSSSENGVSIEAILTEDKVEYKKELTLIASNGGICADKTYKPSFIIDKQITGHIDAPEYICEGHTTTLTASYDAKEFEWSSNEQLGEGITLYGQSINVTPTQGYVSYNVEMKRGACSLSDEVFIDVREAPKFDRIDSVTYKSIEIILQANTGSEPFQYLVDNESDENVSNNVKTGLEYGEHTITVIDDAKCKIDTTVYINNPGIVIPVYFSPNDDGANDQFVVPNLKEAYPDAKIRIYDRWGKKLTEYRAGDEGMDWDGTYQGKEMPSTDYWYEIEIKEIMKTYTGHFTLIRQ